MASIEGSTIVEHKGRPSWNNTFMDMVSSILQRSRCLKIKTAAIIVCDNDILAMGYNGTLPGAIECDEKWRQVYDSEPRILNFEQWMTTNDFRLAHRKWSIGNELHAEDNALQLITRRQVTDKYILYTMYSPCDECAKKIISYGIKTIYYRFTYQRGIEALIRLQQNGVICRQI